MNMEVFVPYSGDLFLILLQYIKHNGEFLNNFRPL